MATIIELRATDAGIVDLAGNTWETHGDGITFEKDCPFGGKKITVAMGSYLTLPAGALPALDNLETHDWTFSFWCNLSKSSQPWATMLNGFRYVRYQRLGLSTSGSGKPHIVFQGSWAPPGANDCLFEADHHVAFVHTKDDGMYRIFVDGNLSYSTKNTSQEFYFNKGGTSLFKESNGDNNASAAGDFWDICFLLDRAEWTDTFTPPTTYLGSDTSTKALLLFDQSTTFDSCGNTWKESGSPSISSDHAKQASALQVTGSDYITLDGSIELGGQDFTIDCWCYYDGDAPQNSMHMLFGLSTSSTNMSSGNSIYVSAGNNSNRLVGNCMQWVSNSGQHLISNKLRHVAMVYEHEKGRARLYVDGELDTTYNGTIARKTFVNVSIGGNPYARANWIGAIDNFRITDGVARWTENFTPPETIGEAKDLSYWSLNRALYKEEAGYADILRHVDGVLIDILRGVASTQQEQVDINRAVWTPEVSSVDVNRSVAVTLDIERLVQSSRAGYFDSSLGIQKKELGYTDVDRRVFVLYDVLRHVQNNEHVHFDVHRDIFHPETFCADTHRCIMVEKSGYLDIHRHLDKLEVRYSDVLMVIPRQITVQDGIQRMGDKPIRSVSLSIAEGTLSDTVTMEIAGELLPGEYIQGGLLDYHFRNFKIERTTHTDLIQTVSSMYDFEKLLYVTYTYPEYDDTKEPMASYHAGQIASKLGMNLVQRYEDFTPDTNYSGARVTYQNLLSSIFGWFTDLPWRKINVFLRDGTIYFLQRGLEFNTVDITDIPHSRPQITRELWRGYPEIVVTKGVSSVGHHHGVYELGYTGIIRCGDRSITYRNGLVTREDDSLGTTTYEYEHSETYPKDGAPYYNYARVKKRSRVNRDGSESVTTISYDEKPVRARNGMVTQTSLASCEKTVSTDKDGNVTENVSYNVQLGSTGQVQTDSATAAEETITYANMAGYGAVASNPNPFKQRQINVALGMSFHDDTSNLSGILQESPFPILDEHLIERYYNEIVAHYGRVQETLQIDLKPVVVGGKIGIEHIIDFTDQVRYMGNTYFLVSNEVKSDSRSFTESLTLVRWL